MKLKLETKVSFVYTSLGYMSLNNEEMPLSNIVFGPQVVATQRIANRMRDQGKA